MKGTKAILLIVTATISVSCLRANVSAVSEPNSYPSICADFNAELLEEWNCELLEVLEKRDVQINEDTLTYSPVYYSYNFYSMELMADSYYRFVFENNEPIALSYARTSDDGVYIQVYQGSYSYLEETFENDSHFLFGTAIVDGFPCSLIYADGVFYSYNSIVYENGATDLVFGEIPYSEYNSGMEPPEDEDTTTTTATEPIEIVPVTGDINLDGKLSLLDLVYLNRINAGVIKPNEEQLKYADCCADGKIDMNDASALLKYLVLDIDALPITPA